MKHIYLTILLSISLLSATVTNTATLSIDSDVSVYINGDFYNSGNIFMDNETHCHDDSGTDHGNNITVEP